MDKMPPSICFVSLQAYPVLAGLDYKTAGGAEVQQVLLANELIKCNFEVSFVVGDYGQNKIEMINGIKTIKSFKLFKGNRVLRFVPDMVSLMKAMNIANADIYYQRAAILYTGPTAFLCSVKNRKFVLSISSANFYSLEYIEKMNVAIKHMYYYGMKIADKIIAQSKHQQEVLKKNFDKDSIVIKTGCINPPNENQGKIMPPIVLWVGTIENTWKQPELFLKLAKTIPNANFQMIGGPARDKQFYERIEEAAREIPNLEFVGFVPYHEVNRYFDRASIFVNTSIAEGFPNTFVQSWARYVPVVSLNVDPDEVICNNKLGFHSKTFEQLVYEVKRLLGDDKLREEMGLNARRYAEKEHDIKKIAREYERVFENLAMERL